MHFSPLLLVTDSSKESTQESSSVEKSLPIIYMITPTYSRLAQKADLTRLCYTLMHVPRLHWIIVEDSANMTTLVNRLLSGNYSCKIPRITHLFARTAEDMRLSNNNRTERGRKRRGELQRNLAIEWLRNSSRDGLLEDQINSRDVKGVVYFGDDDNTYDIQLFEEVSELMIKRWPRNRHSNHGVHCTHTPLVSVQGLSAVFRNQISSSVVHQLPLLLF